MSTSEVDDAAPRRPSLLTAAGRLLLRTAIYPPLAIACIGDFALSSAHRSPADRVRWLQRTAIRHVRWTGVRIRIHGEIPRAGLVVSNHVSYIDVVALSAIGAFAFVAKKEVGAWPLFGAFAKMSGTVFVDRERRGSVTGAGGEIRSHIDAGIPIVLFPEGSSTDGSHLLPFRTPLFEPAVALGCPLTACGLRYSISDGTVADDLAFWGDMDLAPQLARLLTKSSAIVDIHFGPSRIPGGDRKAIARSYEAEVRALAGL